MPPGSVVTRMQPIPPEMGPGYWIGAYVPLSYSDLAHWLINRLSQAGYQLGGGDAEADEIEALFERGELSGAFRSRQVAGCPDISLLEIAIQVAHATPAQ